MGNKVENYGKDRKSTVISSFIPQRKVAWLIQSRKVGQTGSNRQQQHPIME